MPKPRKRSDRRGDDCPGDFESTPEAALMALYVLRDGRDQEAFAAVHPGPAARLAELEEELGTNETLLRAREA